MRSLVLELSSEKWGGGRSRQTGVGVGRGRWGRGGKCRPELLPSLSRGSAQDPPSPCTGDEMRRGSLADSGTIICTSWGERVPGQSCEPLSPASSACRTQEGTLNFWTPSRLQGHSLFLSSLLALAPNSSQNILSSCTKALGYSTTSGPFAGPRAQCATVSRDKQSGQWQGRESWG